MLVFLKISDTIIYMLPIQFQQYLKNPSIKIWLGGIAVITLFILVSSFIIRSVLFSPTRTITVTGIGTQKIKAERAVISFSLLYEAPTQQQAITGGEQRFTALIRALDRFSPVSVDKTTYQLTTRPTTRSTEGGLSAETNFQYVNAARVTINTSADVSQVTRTLYESGATVVSQPRFVPIDEKQTELELRELAIKNARERANKMARTSGANLGKVLTIQEGQSTSQTGTAVTGNSTIQANGQQATVPPSQGGQSAAPSTTNNGEIELQAVVTVVYELW